MTFNQKLAFILGAVGASTIATAHYHILPGAESVFLSLGIVCFWMGIVLVWGGGK